MQPAPCSSPTICGSLTTFTHELSTISSTASPLSAVHLFCIVASFRPRNDLGKPPTSFGASSVFIWIPWKAQMGIQPRTHDLLHGLLRNISSFLNWILLRSLRKTQNDGVYTHNRYLFQVLLLMGLAISYPPSISLSFPSIRNTLIHFILYLRHPGM